MPPRKAASSRSARRARPGTGMRHRPVAPPPAPPRRGGRDIAAGAGDHHADGVEKMAARVVAHLVGERGVAESCTKPTMRLGRADGRRSVCNASAWDMHGSGWARGRNVPHQKRHAISLTSRVLHHGIDGDDALARGPHHQRIDFRLSRHWYIVRQPRQRDDGVGEGREIALGLAAVTGERDRGRAPRRSSRAPQRDRPAPAAGCGRARSR